MWKEIISMAKLLEALMRHWGWYLPTVLVLACAIGVGVRVLSADDRAVDITPPPPPKQPNPNALDYYQRAYDALMSQAARTTIGRLLWASPNPQDPLQYTPEQREAYLAEFASADQLIEEAQQYRCSPWLFNPDGSPQHLMFAPLREIDRYIAFVRETHIAVGRWNDGMSSALDSLRLKADYMQDSGLTGMLIGTTTTSALLKDTWACVEHLTAPQAQTAATRLQTMMAYEPSLAQTLTMQKGFDQRDVLKRLTQPNWQSVYIKDYKLEKATTPEQLTDGKVAILYPYTREMNQRIAEAEKPYVARRKFSVPENPVIAHYFPTVDAPWFRISPYQAHDRHLAIDEYIGFALAKHQTQERLLLLACALRAYNQEHTAYPADLQALAPTYLSKIPDDPFAPSGTFHYKRDGAGYLLYSLGPDGKDNDGRSIDGEVASDSTGDIVAAQTL